MTGGRSFTTRLSLALALLLLAYGAFVAVLGRHVAAEQAQESLQRLSHGLARHIVGHWPEIAAPDRDAAERSARSALLSMLMTVNPGVQVYVLDADGRVQHYIGEPGMVREDQVDLDVIRAFLAGAALPLRGTDPMGSGVPRIFSAAMFPVRAGDTRPPGYLYIVLDGPSRDAVTAQVGADRLWQGAALAAAIGMLVTLGLGLFTFRRLTLPLHRLAQGLRDYSQGRRAGEAQRAAGVAQTSEPALLARTGGDEVRAIAEAFGGMTRRIEQQAEREQRQVADHREMMASVAHDLRTPLTALAGLAESLPLAGPPLPPAQAELAEAIRAEALRTHALARDLLDLARLQADAPHLALDWIAVDELVGSAVQSRAHALRAHALTLEVPDDLPLLRADAVLMERVLCNLLDNAIAHTPAGGRITIGARSTAAGATPDDAPAWLEIDVCDEGCGLPPGREHAIFERFVRGADPGPAGLVAAPAAPGQARTTGDEGTGLGLALVRAIIEVHGGSVAAHNRPSRGACFTLRMPFPPQPELPPPEAPALTTSRNT